MARTREHEESDGRSDRESVGRSESVAREEYGGINWGAAFFGWLVAVGMATILLALVSAAGAAVGLTSVTGQQARTQAGTVSIVGGIILLLVLMLAYYSGGYVAGRMSRFEGGKQGVAVWIFGLAVTVLLAIAGVILGAQFNVLAQLNLPSIPLSGSALTTGGLIALVLVILGTLLAASLGGKAGRRYHGKVDRAGI